MTHPIVKKRQVFYLQGYDPIGPRHYREIYRAEGAKQAEISGYELSLKGQPRQHGNYAWAVDTAIDGQEVETSVEFLLWSDIVRKSMERSIPATFLLMFRIYWIYGRAGTLWRLLSMRIGPTITGLYPPFILFAQLAVAILAGLLGYSIAKELLPSPIGPVAGLLVFGCAVVFLLRWFRSKDNKFYAYYLLYDYSFGGLQLGVNPPALEERIGQFKDRLAAAMKSDVDEVLVVGHSSGAHLATSMIADYLREHERRDGEPALGFLSLGQAIPLISFLPKAQRLRGDLHYLSQSDRITWVDVSSVGDGACYALCDPVMVSGVSPGPDKKKWPLVISAAFGNTLSPKLYKKLRRKFFRLHFQYIHAFDQPGDYDYFKITAGPVTLAERFEGRAPSKSRIERVASPYTDFAPEPVDGI